jgi:hypothetical protein
MSTYERSIVSIIEPSFKKGPTSQGKIVLDEIFIEDTESPESETEYAGNMRKIALKASSRAGSAMPLVAINTLILGENEIEDFEIDLSGKIPKLMLNFNDTLNGHFNINCPIDGDVISVYLRPGDADNQKPIRIDFIINRILGDPINRRYFIMGIMKIHKFYTETFKSFGENTSFEHLGDVCEELGLGFASNETATDDKMKRFIPAETYETFITETVSHSYKNEDSFFDWYIDPYYYLCFVNLNKQFSLEDKIEEVNVSDAFPMSGRVNQGDNSDPDQVKGNLVLTNINNMSGKNIFIENYSFENNAGTVWTENGYKRFAQWLNIEEDLIEYQQAFVDPFTTSGSEDKYILLKGRRADGPPNFPRPLYLDESKYKWMGKQAGVAYGGNVHDNYCFAQVLNHQNLEELRKTRLVVDLAGMNHYIYKYMRIPVVIYETSTGVNSSELQGRNVRLDETGPPTDPTSNSNSVAQGDQNAPDDISPHAPDVRDQIKNEFLSGYYVVGDIRYIYATGTGVKQRLTLIRREWPIPANNRQKG